MKKLAFFLLLVCEVFSQAKAQNITDTGALRHAINTDIVPNSAGGITAVKLNRILNGTVNVIGNLIIDSVYYGHDTIYFKTPYGTFIGVKETCPPTFGEIDELPEDNLALRASLAAKENLITPGNNTFDFARKFFNGYKSYENFDPAVLSALGMTVDTVSGQAFYNWNLNGNFVIARGNINNLDTTGIPGGIYYYNAGTRGTKPGSSGSGIVYLSAQNSINYMKASDKAAMFIIDGNGQEWTRVYSSAAWGSYGTPAYSTDLAGYLANAGNPILNGYLSFVNKSASPTTPPVGQSAFYFDGSGFPRFYTATGNYIRLDTTGMGTGNVTLTAKNIVHALNVSVPSWLTATYSITSNTAGISLAGNTGLTANQVLRSGSGGSLAMGYLSAADIQQALGSNSGLLNATAGVLSFVPIESTQTYTSGASVTVTNGVNVMYINPGSLQASLTITLPATAHSSNNLLILFGGTVTSGNTVVTTLTVSPNSGQSVITAFTPSSVLAGEVLSYKYNSSTSTWYRVN